MTSQPPDDDEALARLLQFQEQSGMTLGTENISSTRSPMSDQEKRDMELAQRMAQMEFMSGSGSNMDIPDQAYRIGGADAPVTSPATTDYLHPRPPQSRSRSVSPGGNAASTSASEPKANRMDRARRLQEQALHDIRQQNHSQLEYASVSASTSAQDDFELAQQIQRAEVVHDKDAEATEDERLARLMAATGRSLRDLSEDDLNDMFLSATHTRSPHRFRRSVSPNQQHVSSMRRNSNSTPSSPIARPRSKLKPAHAFSAPNSPFPVNNADQRIRTATSNSGQTLSPEQAPPRKKPPPTYSNGNNKGSPRRNVRWLRGPPQQGDVPAAGLKPPPAAALKPPPEATNGSAPATPVASSNGGRISSAIPNAPILDIPSAIPPPPRPPTASGKHSVCAKCGLTEGTFLKAKDRFYHPECFRCAACMEKIDTNSPFGFRKVANPNNGNKEEQQPFHANCLPKNPQDVCVVCKQMMPRDGNGLICFVKHPFFDTERMCPKHSAPGNAACVRRCTGCHRFEPLDEPFVDLGDGGRCVCYACCRTVIMDGNDVIPLWKKVIAFFEHKMRLPIWEEMQDIPILVVDYDTLNDQISQNGGSHVGSSQIMTRGLCLTDHQHCRRLKMPSMRFNRSSSSFEARDNDSQGFTYFDINNAKTATNEAGSNMKARVFAIMCLSGLPRDLTASILAHEATHAWLKLHPELDLYNNPLPPQVEEGLAQLVSMLFLNEGLDPSPELTKGDVPPSDDRLRQYFRFCIETDENEIYGQGYQKAAKAYAEVGIQALVRHIVLYGSFPSL